MSYSLNLDHRNGVVVLTYTGEVSAAELRQSRADAAASVEAGGVQRLLVDFRHAVPKFTMEDAFKLTASHAGIFPRGTRVAMVVAEGRLSDFAEFSVTVARNRGFRMEAFADVPAAVRWLAA